MRSLMRDERRRPVTMETAENASVLDRLIEQVVVVVHVAAEIVIVIRRRCIQFDRFIEHHHLFL